MNLPHAKKQLTDWVIENLYNVTSSSPTRAGENDTLPPNGLIISKTHILPSESAVETTTTSLIPIRLLLGKNGWGTGVHPTTRLCLEWLCDVVSGNEVVLDYGCGSGVLGIAALGLGAGRVVGVDVEAEALVTSQKNMELNGYDGFFEGMHTREVTPHCLQPPADICIANILIGQLVRPSMVSAIVSNIKIGAYLCLSGIRPSEVTSLKYAYQDYIHWLDEDYRELAAVETEGSLESYGFDVGTWARVVGRRKGRAIDTQKMSESAVS